MRESDLEKKFRRRVKANGGEAYKFVSPGRRNVPDRIVVLREGRVFFVELKRPGEKLRPAQKRELDRLVDKGCDASWIGDEESMDKWFEDRGLE